MTFIIRKKTLESTEIDSSKNEAETQDKPIDDAMPIPLGKAYILALLPYYNVYDLDKCRFHNINTMNCKIKNTSLS